MASSQLKGSISASETARLIDNEIGELGVSMTLVDRIEKQLGDYYTYLSVYEKYYYRSSNRASLTILITGNDTESVVDIIGSGGGRGIFLKLSLGAENNFVNGLENILLRHNFQKTR